MAAELGGYGTSLADAVASSVNLYLQKLDQIRKTLPVGFTGDHFGVVVIVYGPEPAKQILYLDRSGTRADGNRTVSRESDISPDTGQRNYSFWVKPAAEGRATLCSALSSASDLLTAWVRNHQPAEPPNVIDITDGSAGDGDPRELANKIMTLSTSRGNATLWHCLLAGSHSEPVLFPTDDVRSTMPKEWLSFVDSSSILPRKSIPDLLLQFPEVSKVDGARCCVFNADLAVLVRAISVIAKLPLP